MSEYSGAVITMRRALATDFAYNFGTNELNLRCRGEEEVAPLL